KKPLYFLDNLYSLNSNEELDSVTTGKSDNKVIDNSNNISNTEVESQNNSCKQSHTRHEDILNLDIKLKLIKDILVQKEFKTLDYGLNKLQN
ncbi:3262_t:CDS:2, partial [Dentiscutata erythropus]